MRGGSSSGAAANRVSGGSPSRGHVVRVLVIAAVRLYREGITEALARDDRLSVVWATADHAAALGRLGDLSPDVVLVEAGRTDGPALVRAIRAQRPAARVVALGIADDHAEVSALAAAGLAGWVTRDASVDDMREAVVSAADDEARRPARAVTGLERETPSLAAEAAGAARAVEALTRRQREILALIDEGLSNKEIALRLSIGLPTVKNHVHNILEKLQVSGRGAAAAVVRSPPR
jgi:two-component system, NarL family, nitrate/nitrite response regulator NarL